jgi:hypothetical protein
MQEFSQGYLPTFVSNTWMTNAINSVDQPQRELCTVNGDSIHTLFSKTSALDKHSHFAFPRLWDDYPDELIKFL